MVWRNSVQCVTPTLFVFVFGPTSTNPSVHMLNSASILTVERLSIHGAASGNDHMDQVNGAYTNQCSLILKLPRPNDLDKTIYSGVSQATFARSTTGSTGFNWISKPQGQPWMLKKELVIMGRRCYGLKDGLPNRNCLREHSWEQ
ncbi:hypothetical protein B0J11DRAFT_253246 [Dendryphion nanum]|uniref:Uncharacterized protein n=1 Tax=Dendryphion nanum TaxID=256645 RepID=A0A9P9E5T6_9PLEO|nr:hypothetical protein B0J11DRAFT_253246 [Dendryphion nanum]